MGRNSKGKGTPSATRVRVKHRDLLRDILCGAGCPFFDQVFGTEKSDDFDETLAGSSPGWRRNTGFDDDEALVSRKILEPRPRVTRSMMTEQKVGATRARAESHEKALSVLQIQRDPVRRRNLSR